MGNKNPKSPRYSSKDRGEKILQADIIKSLKSFSEIRKCFDKYDLDKNGVIDKQEYKNFIQDIAKQNQINIDYLSDLMNLFDKNHDGVISYEEFISFISKIKPQNILLLGCGRSGKTTIFKQFLLYDSPNALTELYNLFHRQFVEFVIDLAEGCQLEGTLKEVFTKVKDISIHNPNIIEENYSQIEDNMKYLWLNETIQEEFKKRLAEYDVPELFQRVKSDEDVYKANYKLDENDYLFYTMKSCGIDTYEANINGIYFKVSDSGGQRSERKKWKAWYARSDHICYVVSLSSFDEYCYEDLSVNSLIESYNLLISVLSHPELKGKPLIIFFNKFDQFKKKLKLKSKYQEFIQVFPEYKGEHDEDKMLNFLTNLFLNVCPKETVYYITSSVEKMEMKRVFDDLFCLSKSNQIDVKPYYINLLKSEKIQSLRNFESIQEYYKKLGFGKEIELKSSEFSEFINSLSKEIEGLNVDEVKSYFNYSKKEKITYFDFLSVMSKINPPRILIQGIKDSGKSLLLKNLQIYGDSVKYSNILKSLILNNIQHIFYNLGFSGMFNLSKNELQSLATVFQNTKLTKIEFYFKKNSCFDIIREMIKKEDIASFLKNNYWIKKLDQIESKDYQPTIEDYLMVNLNDFEKSIYQESSFGNVNFSVLNCIQAPIDYIYYLAPLDIIFSSKSLMDESINMFKTLLNEVDLIDKQFIIFFTRKDLFNLDLKNEDKSKVFLKENSDFKDSIDELNVMKYIQDQYLSLTKHSLRKPIIHYECNLFDLNENKKLFNKLFCLE